MMIRRTILLLSAIALLAACDTPPMRQSVATLTFQDRPQIRLDVAQIEIVDAYKAPGVAPHVDHLFPQKPADVAVAWGRDVLHAVGERGMATYTIVDAAATQTALPRATGMTQVFKTEQSDRYDLHIEVKLEVGNPLLASTGFVTAAVNRSQTVAEDMTLNEREAVWFQMTESAMRELDEKLEAAIKDKLKPFVR
jgi:outer membrane lipopolysaccharide assembly protein LptE/RlpB